MSDPNRSGNVGADFNVVNQASEDGLSFDTRGRDRHLTLGEVVADDLADRAIVMIDEFTG